MSMLPSQRMAHQGRGYQRETKPLPRQNRLPRGITPHPNSPLMQLARYARDYEGTFGFMLAMKDKAQNPHWIPTEKQAIAIRKCRQFDKDHG